MKYETTNLKEYGKIKIGAVRQEQTGKRTRHVKCKGIYLGIDNNYYAHWQYLLAKTMKPGGKSTSFLTIIEPIINPEVYTF